ncbi:MAG: TonB-dependent receptor [Polyangiales bacterium]
MTRRARRVRTLEAFLAASAFSVSARADDETEAATVRSRTAPPSQSVIGHAELERTGGTSLADALRPQADVDLLGGGTAGSIGRLSLRGAAPEETLLVIDGLRLSARSSAATVAGLDPNLIPSALLDRVVIQRGPASALWGANAVAGVIEITTREPVAPYTLSGTLQYGAYLSSDDDDTAPATPTDDDDDFASGVQPYFGLRGQLLGAMRVQDRYAMVALTANTTRGWAPNTQTRLLDGTVKVGRTWGAGGSLYTWLRLYDAYTGAPSWGSLLAAETFDADDRQARQGMQLAALARRSIGDRMTLEATASVSLARATLYNPDADATSGTTLVESQQSGTEAQGRIAWTRESAGPLSALSAGVDFGRESLTADGFGVPSATRVGAFARGQLRFGAVGVDLAARVDGDSMIGWVVSPRAAVRVGAADSVARAELSFGRGYRPPTFAERTWPTFRYSAASGSAIGERGNASVAPETAWGVDASVALGGGAHRWQASVRAFGLQTHDMIRWAIDRDGYWTPSNTDLARSAGASVDATVRLTPRLSLVGSAFWQTTRDANGDELAGRLRSKATGRVIWYSREGLRAWAEALWFDRSGVDARGEPWQGVFVNARVGWQFPSGLGVFALGENLLDTRFESARGLPTPGRVAWLGLSIDVDED